MTTLRDDAAERSFVQHEHRELVPGLAHLHEVACDSVGSAAPDHARSLAQILGWYERSVRPHLDWEEKWLYPELRGTTGPPDITQLLAGEHARLRGLVDAIQLDHDQLILHGRHATPREICGRLFALEEGIRAHIDREERYIAAIVDAAPHPGETAMRS